MDQYVREECGKSEGDVVVVDLRLTLEWGVGMTRQDPSYEVVVHMSSTSSGTSWKK